MCYIRRVRYLLPLLLMACTARGEQTPLQEARAFYAAQPEMLRPMPHSPTPPGLPDLSAASCGICHQEIYAEWKVSTHARAWLDDAQFQEELKKSRKQGVDWMCVNCHTPMESQLERLVRGLREGKVEQPIYTPNPNYDPKLQLEAITCATCHVREGTILGPYGDTSAPHPVKKAPELLSVQVCTQCHQAVAHFRRISLACTFDTGNELASGPYAGKKICQDCHMPVVERPLMAGFPKRKTRRHWFGGSLIPKKPEYEAEIAPLRAVFPEGLAARWVDPPKQVKAGAGRALVFEAHNAQAGHLLPTGDPERFILLEGSVLDAEGKVLARHEARFGTRYQWSPQVKKLEDTRLKPQERRRFTLKFTAPAKGPLRLRLKASKWRIGKEAFDYHHLEGRYVPGRSIFERVVELPVGPRAGPGGQD